MGQESGWDRSQGRDRSRDGDTRDACQDTRMQAFREELPVYDIVYENLHIAKYLSSQIFVCYSPSA